MDGSTRFTLLLVLFACRLFPQNPETPERGFTFYERFEGSANQLGVFTKLDTTVGYNLNTHVSFAAGLPVYFVRPSGEVTRLVGTQSANGIGNVYGQVRLMAATVAINVASTLTVTAPTGDKAKGFSTGHATVDWSNYFDRSLGRITPFGEIGFANSVSDTFFFQRPYTTQGFVAHVQGGGRFQLARTVAIGASGYAVEPSGQQTVISRVARATAGSSNANSNSRGRGNHGVFETVNNTVVPSDLARDHGVSAWLKISPASAVDFYGGYTRSTKFALDTVFFGIGVNVGKIVRNRGV
jgi:hypothetical protein